MDFEWDPAKAEANLRKHHVAFPIAERAFDDPVRLERIDDSFDYGEVRWILIGCVETTVLFVVYTQRDDTIRLISARKADRYEQQIYWDGYAPS